MSNRNSIRDQQFSAENSSDGNVCGSDSSSPEYSSEEEMEKGQTQNDAGGAYQRSEASMKRRESYLELSDQDSYEESYVSRVHDGAEESMVQTVGPVQEKKAGCNPAIIVLILCIIVGLAIIAVAVVLCIVCNKNDKHDISSTTGNVKTTTPTDFTTPSPAHTGETCGQDDPCVEEDFCDFKQTPPRCEPKAPTVTTTPAASCKVDSDCAMAQLCREHKCKSSLSEYFMLSSRKEKCSLVKTGYMSVLEQSTSGSSSPSVAKGKSYNLCDADSAGAVFPDGLWQNILDKIKAPLYVDEATLGPLLSEAPLKNYLATGFTPEFFSVVATCNGKECENKFSKTNLDSFDTCTTNACSIGIESTGNGNGAFVSLQISNGKWTSSANEDVTTLTFTNPENSFTKFQVEQQLEKLGFSYSTADYFKPLSAAIADQFQKQLCQQGGYTDKCPITNVQIRNSSNDQEAELVNTTKLIVKDIIDPTGQCSAAFETQLGWAKYASLEISNCSMLSGLQATNEQGVETDLFKAYNNIITNVQPGLENSHNYGFYFNTTKWYVELQQVTTTDATTDATATTSDATATTSEATSTTTDPTATTTPKPFGLSGVVLGYTDETTRVIVSLPESAHLKLNQSSVDDPTQFITALTNAASSVSSENQLKMYTLRLCDNNNPCKDIAAYREGVTGIHIKELDGTSNPPAVYATIAGVVAPNPASQPTSETCSKNNSVMQKTSSDADVATKSCNGKFNALQVSLPNTTVTGGTTGAAIEQNYCLAPTSTGLSNLFTGDLADQVRNAAKQFPAINKLTDANKCTENPLEELWGSDNRQKQKVAYANNIQGERKYAQCLTAQFDIEQGSFPATWSSDAFKMIQDNNMVLQFGKNFIVLGGATTSTVYAIVGTGNSSSSLLVYPVGEYSNSGGADNALAVVNDLSTATTTNTSTATTTPKSDTTSTTPSLLQRWTRCDNGEESHIQCVGEPKTTYVIDFLIKSSDAGNTPAQVNLINLGDADGKTINMPYKKMRVSACLPEDEKNTLQNNGMNTACDFLTVVPLFGVFFNTVCGNQNGWTAGAIFREVYSGLGAIAVLAMFFGNYRRAFLKAFDTQNANEQDRNRTERVCSGARAVFELIPGVSFLEYFVGVAITKFADNRNVLGFGGNLAFADTLTGVVYPGFYSRYQTEMLLHGEAGWGINELKFKSADTKALMRKVNRYHSKNGNLEGIEIKHPEIKRATADAIHIESKKMWTSDYPGFHGWVV